MKRTKWKVPDKSEPPKIKIPDIPKAVYNLLSSNALKLYMFYRFMVKEQNTDQIYAKDIFCMNKKGLGWSRSRFYSAKNELYSIGLIETIQSFKENKGDFDKKYLKIYFVVDEKYLSTAELQRRTNGIYNNTDNNLKNSDSTAESNSKAAKIQRGTNEAQCAKQYTNALKKHNKYKTVYSEKNLYKDFLTFFPNEWLEYLPFKKAIHKLSIHYIESNRRITQTSARLIAREIKSLGSPIQASLSINKSIKNGWSGFYPEKNSNQDISPVSNSKLRPTDFDTPILWWGGEMYEKKSDGKYYTDGDKRPLEEETKNELLEIEYIRVSKKSNKNQYCK